MPPDPAAKLRLDKWLWYARFFKSRSLASRVVGEGQVRVNGVRTDKPAHAVGPGDVLTFVQVRRVRVVRLVATGTHRGPAEMARSLYDDLSPAEEPASAAESGGARPTKRDRRAIDSMQRNGG